MIENTKNCGYSKPRFELREIDYAIIDNENEIAPIMVQMNGDDEDSQHTDRSSVVNLLNRLNHKANDKSINLSVYDAIVEIERKLVVLEKIMKEINYIGRLNFKETKDFSKQRENQYLIEIQNHYERAFREAYKAIIQAKRGLKE